MKIKNPLGSTPLDDETLNGLIPRLATQQELNEFEANNIAKAIRWAESSRTLKKDLLSASGLCQLHKKMFDETWEWAGEFRLRETNIGVTPARIQNDLGALLGNVNYWLENKTFDLDEIAIRFHQRLVWIHLFPNGNGRHARLATNLLLQFNGGKTFTWGSESLLEDSPKRKEYIKALITADKSEDYKPLLKFARS